MSMVRVTRDNPCPVCNKPDWCLLAQDKGVAICSRVESTYPKAGAGWLHKLTDDWKRPAWTPVKRQEPKPTVDWLALCIEHRRACRRKHLAWLSGELGVTVGALKRLRVGWNNQRKAFAFPMREANGNPVGIRYRLRSGKKFSELHSSEGMFFLPGDLIRDYLVVVEGASDAAAVMDCGYISVIGRANCRGNVGQIENLCRRLQPKVVVIIPDPDFVGIQGANQLRLRIERQAIPVKTLVLPEGQKDVRALVQLKENADWLADQIGKLTEQSPMQEATSNDDPV